MVNEEKFLDEVFELAVKNEMTYYGCSQACLGALCEKFEEIDISVFKAGSSLAAGVARLGQTCGALIGGLMAVGSIIGREKLEDMQQYQLAMAYAQRIVDLFQQQLGSTICSDIQRIRFGRPFNLNNPKEMEAFEEAGGHRREGCPEVCGVAARLAAEVILGIKAAGPVAREKQGGF